MLRLGAVRAGGPPRKEVVKIINRSPCEVEFHVTMGVTNDLLNDEILSVKPSRQIRLKENGGTEDILVVFAPKTRIPDFVEEVIT